MNAQIAADLGRIIGPDNILADERACALATADLFPNAEQAPALLCLLPESTQAVAEAMAYLHSRKIPVTPRGAGLSYTGGVSPDKPAVVIDTARLEDIEIHADDLYARVGAGVSWEKLHEALRPYRLKCAQPNPISGAVTTVGGAAAQNVPGGMDGFLGVVVVLADGSIVRTGAAASGHENGFWRHNGPDLTGLFLGDCGAFGVKTELILRLMRVRPAAFASFAFDHVQQLLDAMAPVLRDGLVTRAVAMDPLKTRQATKVDAGEAAKIVGAVVSQSGSLTQSIKNIAQLARSTVAANPDGWVLHLTCEAATQTGADAQLALAKNICARNGREIDNVIPKTLHARPYSIRGFVGPQGERWAPIHGILSLSRAQACMNDLLAFVDRRKGDMDSLGISVNWIASSIGPYVTIEAMFYWTDALDALHFRHLSARNAERFKHADKNEPARAAIAEWRCNMREIYDAHGAVHAQIGRFYHLPDAAAPLARKLKKALDADGMMNPGVLGL